MKVNVYECERERQSSVKPFLLWWKNPWWKFLRTDEVTLKQSKIWSIKIQDHIIITPYFLPTSYSPFLHRFDDVGKDPLDNNFGITRLCGFHIIDTTRDRCKTIFRYSVLPISDKIGEGVTSRSLLRSVSLLAKNIEGMLTAVEKELVYEVKNIDLTFITGGKK